MGIVSLKLILVIVHDVVIFTTGDIREHPHETFVYFSLVRFLNGQFVLDTLSGHFKRNKHITYIDRYIKVYVFLNY